MRWLRDIELETTLEPLFITETGLMLLDALAVCMRVKNTQKKTVLSSI